MPSSAVSPNTACCSVDKSELPKSTDTRRGTLVHWASFRAGLPTKFLRWCSIISWHISDPWGTFLHFVLSTICPSSHSTKYKNMWVPASLVLESSTSDTASTESDHSTRSSTIFTYIPFSEYVYTLIYFINCQISCFTRHFNTKIVYAFLVFPLQPYAQSVMTFDPYTSQNSSCCEMYCLLT